MKTISACWSAPARLQRMDPPSSLRGCAQRHGGGNDDQGGRQQKGCSRQMPGAAGADEHDLHVRHHRPSQGRAAARAGAENVTATDINPNAALTAAENARANGMGDRVTAVCTNLLSALAPRPLFDVILSSPPKHAGEPRDLADRGWHAGPNYRDIAALFDQSRERLKPGGRLYVMVSSDSDLDLLGTLIDRAGFSARVVYEHSIFIESLIIYELLAR